MDWRRHYEKNLMTAEEATKLVKSGDRVCWGFARQPWCLTGALAKRRDLRNVEILCEGPRQDDGWIQPGETEQSFKVVTFIHLVKDGSTIEIGFGPITGRLAQLGLFDDKGDLGIHSEMAARGIGKLIEKGVINGSRKTLNPNKAVFTSIEGFSADELEWAEENPLIELRNADYVININTIASHDNMLAMNTALSIDLTGQIACESIFGGRLVAGVGGQPEFHIGAFLSRGGRAITFLFSTAQNGAVSRIVPQFDEGAIVDVPRYCTDTVITEYGAVELIGKTRRERAEALISIAHPKFRGELRKAADKMSGW
jgi:4-hydroxybutyrate CoA-transferase